MRLFSLFVETLMSFKSLEGAKVGLKGHYTLQEWLFFFGQSSSSLKYLIKAKHSWVRGSASALLMHHLGGHKAFLPVYSLKVNFNKLKSSFICRNPVIKNVCANLFHCPACQYGVGVDSSNQHALKRQVCGDFYGVKVFRYECEWMFSIFVFKF